MLCEFEVKGVYEVSGFLSELWWYSLRGKQVELPESGILVIDDQ